VPGLPPVQQISIGSSALAVVDNVTVGSPGTQTGAVGTPITPITLSATPAATYSWSATDLPPGISLDAATGTMSGNPTTAGTFSVAVTAKSADGSGRGRAFFTFTIDLCAGPGQKLANPGFESGPTGWSATPEVIVQNSLVQRPRTGTWNAWMNGLGQAHTDTVSQSVTIPAGCTDSTLTYWLHIGSDEDDSRISDRLTVTLGSTTLATFSNVDRFTGYIKHSVQVGAFAGQTVTLTFTGVEDATVQTSFVLDDVTLTVG
jgi:hypothetical protein